MGNINTLLSLNGESEFKRQITAINNNLTTLDKALKETASLFTQESDRMKLTTATSQNLERQLDLLRQKQQMLNQAVMGSAKNVQDSTKDLMNARQAWANTAVNVDLLRKKLDEAKSGTTASRQEIRELEKQLKLAEQAHKDAGKAVEDAERRVARAKSENQKYRQQLADTGTQINKTEAELRRLAQEEDNQARTTQNATNYTNQFKTALTGLKTALEAAGTACAKIAQAELKGLQMTFQAVGKELELGVSGLKKYTEAVTAAGIAIGSFGAAKGMDFEASMSRVSAYSNASSEDLERLAAAAKDMGATTSKTASEAADALGYLALNGYNTEQMLSSLKPIVKASEAGNMSLATVADAVANSLTSYGKGAEDAEEFLNVLTAAQNNSSTSMEQLLTTYRDLSGTFKMLDVDFNESATLLGLVANRGLKGAEAGTALNSVMLRLLGTNKNAATALNSIGVSAWDAEG
ncbi:MAG: phage tail tape measure protein, partial [Prevotella sp.]|nr:phage tail tape measure protein [Prevotella sp.]